MLKLYHILLLVVIVFFQCVSSHNNEQQTSLPIYTSTKSLFTFENFNQFKDCSTNFKTLERALYLTDNNRFALISAFYPARESPTLFLNVRYNFSYPENYQTELNICHNWLWTTGTFYLIQSPDVFLFTSLLFVHPENKVRTLKLTLPSQCADLAYTCASNPNSVSMLEVLTRRLKLYARYNNLDYVSVSDENAYAAKAVPVLDINTIYDQSVKTYFSFVIVFPISIIIMLTVVCFKGSRLQLRVKLSNPRNFPSIAALATMGMLFSLFVVSLDICALVWAFSPHISIQENELLQSGFNSTIESHNIAKGTLVVDLVATLFSCVMFVIGIVVECGHFCCQRKWVNFCCRFFCSKCDKILNFSFRFWICPIFCCSQLEPSRSKEKMNWILAATCIAPIVCFGSHIGFVVLAWLADPKHAGAVSVIYIFMFFYYYVTLKAFYQLLTDGKAGCLICCQKKIKKKRCCSCCCNCLLKFPKLDNELNEHQPLCELNDMKELESPEKEIENREKVFPDTHVSFCAILMTGIFGVFLASLQVYSIASLVLLPLIGVIQDTPNYILSFFQVAVFFLTAVITYAIITAEEPVERELVKSVARNFYYYLNKFKQTAAPQQTAQQTTAQQLTAAPPPTAQQAAPPQQTAQQTTAQQLTAAPPPTAQQAAPPQQTAQQTTAPQPGAQQPTAQQPGAQQSTARGADKPERADVVHKVGNIVGALAYKQLSSHVVIRMDANDEDDLLKPAPK